MFTILSLANANDLISLTSVIREKAISAIKDFNRRNWIFENRFKTPVKLTTREWCKHRHNYLYLRRFNCMEDGLITCEMHREYHPDIACEIFLHNLPTEDLLLIMKALSELD